MAKKHKTDVNKVEPVSVEVDISRELFELQEVPDMPDGAITPVLTKPVYIVPCGSALSCKTRIVAGGEIVTADMVIGGQETIDRLVLKGALVAK
jgi:hypothetical protein